MKSGKRVGGCKRVKVISLIDYNYYYWPSEIRFPSPVDWHGADKCTFPRFFLGKHMTVPRTRYIQG